MNSTTSDSLIPLTTAAKAFGYLDSTHFRLNVASRLGLRVLTQGLGPKRHFVWKSEFEQALERLKASQATAAAS